MLRILRNEGVTLLFTSQATSELPDDDLQYLSDGAFELTNDTTGRRLRVRKFRGSGPSEADWDVIEAGYETPRRHADELGRWVLRWVTTTAGGELVRERESNTLHVQCPVRSWGAAVADRTEPEREE